MTESQSELHDQEYQRPSDSRIEKPRHASEFVHSAVDLLFRYTTKNVAAAFSFLGRLDA